MQIASNDRDSIGHEVSQYPAGMHLWTLPKHAIIGKTGFKLDHEQKWTGQYRRLQKPRAVTSPSE